MKQQVEDALNNRQGTLGITLEMLLEVTLFPEGQEVPILDESLSGSFTSANSVPESGGGVVGIAIGVVGGVVAVLVAVLVYCYCKKKQRQPPGKIGGRADAEARRRIGIGPGGKQGLRLPSTPCVCGGGDEE